MASIILKNEELKFTNFNAATGAISFGTNNKIVANRSLQSSAGIVASSFVTSSDENYTIGSEFDDITIGQLKFKDDSGDVVTVQAPSSITSYNFTLPGSQGSANTFVKNDGSGNLSFASPTLGWTQYGSTITSFTDSNKKAEVNVSDFYSGNSGREMLIVACHNHSSHGKHTFLATIHQSLVSTLKYSNGYSFEMSGHDTKYVIYQIKYDSNILCLYVGGTNMTMHSLKLYTR